MNYILKVIEYYVEKCSRKVTQNKWNNIPTRTNTKIQSPRQKTIFRELNKKTNVHQKD